MNTDRLKDVHDALVRLADREKRAMQLNHRVWMAQRELDKALEAFLTAGVYPSDPTTKPSNQPLFKALEEQNKGATLLSRQRYCAASDNDSRLTELLQLFGLKKLAARKPRPPDAA